MGWKGIAAFVICMAICMAGAAGICAAKASDNKQGEAGNGIHRFPEPDYDDPDYIKRMDREEGAAPFSLGGRAATENASPYTGLIYSHAEKFNGKDIIHGIDVSKWQGRIDWGKVKAAGVRFAFIRCGYTALTDPFRMYEDEYFRQNVKGANAAGIKVGVYFFSNAKTEAEVRKEAYKTLETINGFRSLISLPVVYDYEAFTEDYRAYGTPKHAVTKNARIYMDTIKSAGYEPMYYGCPDVLHNLFNVSGLWGYKCWLANYTTKTAYTGDYQYWQYSESGRVDGIYTDVDCDFYYGDGGYPWEPYVTEKIDAVPWLKMASNSVSSITVKWAALGNADGYALYRSSSLNGAYKRVKAIWGRGNTKYKDRAVAKSEGRQYYYKVAPFIQDGNGIKYGPPSGALAANTEKTHKTGVRTTASVNMRAQAGTEFTKLALIPEGEECNALGYTYAADGTKWHKVTYGGRDGYISGTYASQLSYGRTRKKSTVRAGAGTYYKKKAEIAPGKNVTALKEKKDNKGRKWSYIEYMRKGRKRHGYILSKNVKPRLL